jgi:hypothetical protein
VSISVKGPVSGDLTLEDKKIGALAVSPVTLALGNVAYRQECVSISIKRLSQEISL